MAPDGFPSSTDLPLFHDFLLLATATFPYGDYSLHINNKLAIRLHDSILRYMHDSLMWIDCHNPAMHMAPHKGLNYYGPTVIKRDGAQTLARVLDAWIALFSLGPQDLLLTGPYSWTKGDDPSTGFHEKLAFNRDDLVSLLNSLLSLAQAVVHGGDDAYILHEGI